MQPEVTLCAARFAPGKCRVTAAVAGISVARATTIPVTGQRELIFRWERAESKSHATPVV